MEEIKKYNLRCGYCGTDHYVNRFLLYLRLLVFDEYYHKCPYCHKISRYRLISHIVHDVVESKELEWNKNVRKEVKR